MKAIFTCIFLCTIKFSFAASTNSISPGDSIIKKAYKINREEFLEKYGCDDSSRALINFYFKKRNHQKGNFLAGAGALLIAGIAFGSVNNLMNDDKNYNYDNGLPNAQTTFLAIAIIVMAFMGLPLIISGGTLWIIYSRKKLLKLLDRYNNGKSIPRGISRNKMFRGFLLYDRWDYYIKREIKLADLIGINTEKKKMWDEYRNRRLQRNQKNAIPAQ
jgi:hypothetical protein